MQDCGQGVILTSPKPSWHVPPHHHLLTMVTSYGWHLQHPHGYSVCLDSWTIDIHGIVCPVACPEGEESTSNRARLVRDMHEP
jgi:hypothetical protein